MKIEVKLKKELVKSGRFSSNIDGHFETNCGFLEAVLSANGFKIALNIFVVLFQFSLIFLEFDICKIS